jgi:hypothetical protein
MIYEWKLDGVTRNFGDALPEVFLDPLKHHEWSLDPSSVHFPIGSVISNTHLKLAADAGKIAVFHGCGWRGESLDPELLETAEFDGVRGPNTQAELRKHGIETEITLDPAYMLPGIYPKSSPNGLAFAVRHILDKSDYNVNSIHELGADALFSPVVEDRADILAFIDKVSGARFVLAGSMHAAIVAHAYEVPFALLGGEYIDCEPKWADWLNSVGVTDVRFVHNVKDGREWYRSALGTRM